MNNKALERSRTKTLFGEITVLIRFDKNTGWFIKSWIYTTKQDLVNLDPIRLGFVDEIVQGIYKFGVNVPLDSELRILKQDNGIETTRYWQGNVTQVI